MHNSNSNLYKGFGFWFPSNLLIKEALKPACDHTLTCNLPFVCNHNLVITNFEALLE